MSKNMIDVKKLEKTLGVKYKISKSIGVFGSSGRFNGYYVFSLREEGRERGIELLFNKLEPNTVYLQIEVNGYQSDFHFDGVNDVQYIPEYKKVIFKSGTKKHLLVLEIFARGQFELWT